MNSARSSSSSVCSDSVPDTSREAPAPAPTGLGGLHRGGDHAGVSGQAEVVVPGQVEQRLPTVGVAQRPGQPLRLALGGLLGEPVVVRAHGCAFAIAPTMPEVIVARSSAVLTNGGIV